MNSANETRGSGRHRRGRPQVCVARCATYDACGPALTRVLESSRILDRLAGRRVLLKPNLMKAAAPEACEGTHPRFIAELTGQLVRAGCEVFVGDSSGVLGFSSDVLVASGVAQAVRDAGGIPRSLDAGPFEKIRAPGFRGPTFWVPRLLFEVDVVLQVPKLKTHTLMNLSCAVKNLMGVLPGATKCDLHVRRPTAFALAQGLLILERALSGSGVVLGGAIVDGIWALAGKGRSQEAGGPHRRALGLIVAGEDLTAVDVVCAASLGFAPAEIPTLRAAQRSRGKLSLNDIELHGERFQPLHDLERPVPSAKDRSALLHLLHYFARGHALRPVHQPGLCEAHGACRDVCPTKAITGERGSLRIERTCIRCYACHEVCPTKAMALRMPSLLRPLFAKRAAGLDLSKLR